MDTIQQWEAPRDLDEDGSYYQERINLTSLLRV